MKTARNTRSKTLIKENIYETTFILPSDAFAKRADEITSKLEKTIESLGGKIRVSRLFDERKLAYAIDNRTRGVYWTIYYRIETNKTAELDLQFRLNNDVMRYLTLKLDPRLEEVVLQRTLAEPASESEGQDSDVKVDVDEDDEDEEDVEDEASVDEVF